MYEPDGGNVDPSGVTTAYAAGARQRGAEIHRFTPVTATEPQPDGSWIVRTPKGDIRTQWVVNAAGLWGREVAALAGLELPLIPTEHQYFVTETIPEIAALGRRLPSVADRDGEYYLRQEGLGLLVGAYERNMKFWAEDGHAARLRPRAVPGRSRPHRGQHDARHRPRAGRRHGRHQARHQRPDDLVARQRRAVRPGAGTAATISAATASFPASRSPAAWASSPPNG